MQLFSAVMRVLSITCRCGHTANIEWPDGRSTLRDYVLPRARCVRCGKLGAEDMRVIWIAEASIRAAANHRDPDTD